MASSNLTDIIVIGAGLAGICTVIKLQQKYPHASINAYDKADDIGGTWSKNTYPNLSCDIPSPLYSYSFALKPDWSKTYATQPEILAYIHQVASAYDCHDRIHLKQQCLSADWLDDQHLWRVRFHDHYTGKTYIRDCRILITAVGFSDAPNGPEGIQNIQEFSGSIFHSANWDHLLDFRGKDVLVVGNGCSANQFIPWLVENSDISSLVQIVRSAHWIAPKENHIVGRAQKWAFRNVPLLNKVWRLWLAAKFDLAFPTFKNNAVGRYLREKVQSSITNFMQSTAPASYRSILIPEFAFGAKRPVMDHGYLKSLHDPRVTLVKSKTLEIVGPNRLRDDKGSIFPADVIILANGFKTQQLLTPMVINGLSGAKLPNIWQQEARYASAYMGVSVAGFPNLFLLTGPNTLPSGHSTLIGIECSVSYILRLLDRISPSLGSAQRTNTTIQAKHEAQTKFNDWIGHKMDELVYTPDVENWYIDRRTGRNTLIWPGSQFDFWWSRCVRPVKWTDFEIETADLADPEDT